MSKITIQLRILLIFILLTFNTTLLLAESDPGHSEIKNVEDDIHVQTLNQYFTLSSDYFNHANDAVKADSISEIAIEYATNTYRPELILKAYNNYLVNNNLSLYQTKALEYANEAKKLSMNLHDAELEWQSEYNLARVYKELYNYDKALISAYASVTIARDFNSKDQMIRSYFIIGECLQANNQMIDALRNFFLAAKLSYTSDDDELKKKSYALLSGFYRANKVYQKAAEYKLLEQSFVIDHHPIDSLALMFIELDLQQINLLKKDPRINEKAFRDIYSYSIRHHEQKLRVYSLAMYRSLLTKLNRFDMLKELYTEDYPDEFEEMRVQSPSFYNRLKAYFSELDGRNDSAHYYFKQSEILLNENPNMILRSNFHYRFGQFLIRNNQADAALVQMKKSFDLADQAKYLDYMFQASSNLEKLYAEKRQFEKAYDYANTSNVLKDSMDKLAAKDQLMIMEINHETRQKELEEELEKQKTLKRHQLQYTGMVIGILAVFIIMIMLGSFKVPKVVIQAMGFVSFIFLFEFIILLADQKIHHMTHGEPWKILLIKIFLIGILLPLHHWIEHKVVHYLIDHRLINFSKYSLKNIFGKKKQQA